MAIMPGVVGQIPPRTVTMAQLVEEEVDISQVVEEGAEAVDVATKMGEMGE